MWLLYATQSKAQIFCKEPNIEYISGKFDTLFHNKYDSLKSTNLIQTKSLHRRFKKFINKKNHKNIENLYYKDLADLFIKSNYFKELVKDTNLIQLNDNFQLVDSLLKLYRPKIEIQTIIKTSNLLATLGDTNKIFYKKGVLIRFSSPVDKSLEQSMFYFLTIKECQKYLFYAYCLKFKN